MQSRARLAFCSLCFACAAPLGAQSVYREATSTRGITPDAILATPATRMSDAGAAMLRATLTTPAWEPAAQRPTAIAAPETDLRAGVHALESNRPAADAAVPDRANLGQSRALMAVGLGGLIVGAIIGGTPGTVIMVGGALVGLKGLYDYLQ